MDAGLSFVGTGFRWITLSAFLIARVSFDGQTATAMPALSGIAHAAIRVSDLARSRAFYEKLGFEEAFAMDKGGTPTEAFLKINDRQFIELYPQRDASQAIGFMHVCFESAELEALNGDYVARGLTPPVPRSGSYLRRRTSRGPPRNSRRFSFLWSSVNRNSRFETRTAILSSLSKVGREVGRD